MIENVNRTIGSWFCKPLLNSGEEQSFFSKISDELMLIIFSNLDDFESASLVCRRWNILAKDQMLVQKNKPKIAFSKNHWKELLGIEVEEPPLPKEIHKMINEKCPFFHKKIKESQALILIPDVVNGKPFTVKVLTDLFNHKFENLGIKENKCFLENREDAIKASHWVLITKEVIPSTMCLGEPNRQKELLAKLGKGEYTIPTKVEIAACIYAEYAKTKKVHFLDFSSLVNEENNHLWNSFGACLDEKKNTGFDVYSFYSPVNAPGLAAVKRL